MKVRTHLYITALMLLVAPACKAYTTGDGICHSEGGAYMYNLNLNGQKIPADKNKAGTEVRDMATLTSSATYKVDCNCLTHFSSTFRNIYYTARSPLSEDVVKNGYTYYRLNDNLSIATSIQIYKRGYIPVPFSAEPNQMGNGSACFTPSVEGSTVLLNTGSEITISFLVNKPFIGRVSVPGTVVADLYGGLDAATSTSSTEKLAEIRIAGDIVVPQNCEIAPGQTLEIDFGKIPATEFSSTKGTAVSNRKVKKTIQVQCTGMLDEEIVYSTLHADPVDADAMMMKVNGNDDVGIVVYDKWERQVSVNGGRMDMDMGANNGGAENNSLTFSAAPASATGAQPKPGTFEAYATITLEIEP
ncbi:fimbrial protein StgD [Enterobacter hormaechei]|uniref:fimbrial protein StgD n=1 Tax=Enterobacter hormaechei TaxID=158836 RepID=UPI00298B2592|nr:fimbrial protein StgD [Enterobacter hormaechei]HBL5174783.1 fimbrial protein StgD [Enterobacter hormaechei]HBL6014420.1 fimbrial protein StgD [Enterobacter hormaechei]HBL6128041.1 fimbrial protein StgD [Enterobacter hormaechei]HBL8994503.1 fimbrial protein StgD [Enterobacter hormaechei]